MERISQGEREEKKITQRNCNLSLFLEGCSLFVLLMDKRIKALLGEKVSNYNQTHLLVVGNMLRTSFLAEIFKVTTNLSSCLIKTSFRSFASNSLKETKLTQFHIENGGKMVEFAGFSMPLQYKFQSIIEAHLHTRKTCSVFDVSHMLQSRIHGKDRIEFIESLTVADVNSMKDDSSTLSLFPNESGGIEDDLIITKTSLGYLYLVTNAGCIEKDKKLLEGKLDEMKSDGKDVTLEYMDHDYSLLALQGPTSADVLQKLVPYELKNQKFMTTCLTEVAGKRDVRVTRCGYTGEDGFELSIPNDQVLSVITSLLEAEQVCLAGLGPRDTLRLEAGLCLYGNDMTSVTTIPEAGLVWVIGKARRQKADFKGAGVILKQINEKPKVRRVGLIAIESGPAARHSHVVLDESGQKEVGKVTSGGRSPCLDKNIAMAYVDTTFTSPKTVLNCSVRGKMVKHEVVKMPFVPTNYYI